MIASNEPKNKDDEMVVTAPAPLPLVGVVGTVLLAEGATALADGDAEIELDIDTDAALADNETLLAIDDDGVADTYDAKETTALVSWHFTKAKAATSNTNVIFIFIVDVGVL